MTEFLFFGWTNSLNSLTLYTQSCLDWQMPARYFDIRIHVCHHDQRLQTLQGKRFPEEGSWNSGKRRQGKTRQELNDPFCNVSSVILSQTCVFKFCSFWCLCFRSWFQCLLWEEHRNSVFCWKHSGELVKLLLLTFYFLPFWTCLRHDIFCKDASGNCILAQNSV